MQDKEEIFEVPPEGLNVGELADLLAVNAAEVVKALFMKGVMAQVNQQLDIETVRLAAAAFGAEAVEAGEAVRIPCSLLPAWSLRLHCISFDVLRSSLARSLAWCRALVLQLFAMIHLTGSKQISLVEPSGTSPGLYPAISSCCSVLAANMMHYFCRYISQGRLSAPCKVAKRGTLSLLCAFRIHKLVQRRMSS